MYSGIDEMRKMRNVLAAGSILSPEQEDALSVAMGNYIGKEETKKEDIESVAKAIEPMVRELAFLRELESGDIYNYTEDGISIAFCTKPKVSRNHMRIIDDEDVQYQWSEGYDEMLALKEIQTSKVRFEFYTTNKYIHMLFNFTREDE